jgi:hypothetical protein
MHARRRAFEHIGLAKERRHGSAALSMLLGKSMMLDSSVRMVFAEVCDRHRHRRRESKKAKAAKAARFLSSSC